MKKLLLSALLTGLFLGTTSPVFAASGVFQDTTAGKTSTSSELATSYTITVPEKMTLNLLDSAEGMKDSKDIVLTELNTAGSVSVTATATSLEIVPEEGIANKTINVSLDVQDVPFSLSNSDKTKAIELSTTEDSKEKIAGTYTGFINYAFKFEEATPL